MKQVNLKILLHSNCHPASFFPSNPSIKGVIIFNNEEEEEDLMPANLDIRSTRVLDCPPKS